MNVEKRPLKKLPKLSLSNLIYKKVSLEQASSELTANYKSTFIKGKRLIDLTGGLGIDSIYYSKVFDEVIYCELNKDLSEFSKSNFNELKINNISINNVDSINYLQTFNDKHFDWIYVDPARRDESKRSVDINYYSPNVIENFSLLKSKTKNLCIKVAPAFDITEAYKLFNELNDFQVVSVNNECKEVLLIFNFGKDDKYKSAVVINNNGNVNFYRKKS